MIENIKSIAIVTVPVLALVGIYDVTLNDGEWVRLVLSHVDLSDIATFLET